MDYVAGTDANVLMSERYPTGMPARQAAEIITAIASALDYAHQRGLLHRDVKPANILIADFETNLSTVAQRIFLADFGIARSMLEATGLTATNTTIGTIAYASPEQLSGRPMDGRSDQYSLACTAYDLLTGSAPFSGGDAISIVGQHLSMPAPPIGYRQAQLTALDPVFARALAKDPQARYASCTDFANDLTRAIESGRASSTVVAPWPSMAPPTSVAPTMAPMPQPFPAQSGSRRTLLIIGSIVTVVVLAVVGIVAVALSGDDATVAGPGRTSSSQSPGTTPAPGDASAPSTAPNIPTPTSSALTVDGQPRAMSGRTICITQGTKVLMTVIDMASPVAVTVGLGDDPVV
jgi:serine/threonine-protein kinase